MQRRGAVSREPARLDRSSFVPLYYQLQEILKEEIESGVWAPGDRLPSEPELAAKFGVSRIVVRQALAILEDDRQIRRVRAKGTFVAEPKMDHHAGGLSRLLVAPRGPDANLQVLDNRVVDPEPSIRARLAAPPETEVLRITTLLAVRGLPVAISYSFFRRADVGWLEQSAPVGRSLPGELLLGDHGVTLGRPHIVVETSQCGQFEADRFGVPRRSAVFLVLCTEHRRTERGDEPFEVARVEYRGDVLQLNLGFPPPAAEEMAVTWALSPEVG